MFNNFSKQDLIVSSEPILYSVTVIIFTSVQYIRDHFGYYDL